MKAKGNASFSAKNFPEAIHFFTQAIELAPKNHVLYSNRSASYTSLRQFDHALEDAKACISINPTWAKGYNRKGASLFGLGDLVGAKDAYDEALKLDANNAAAKDGLKQVNEAIEQEAREDNTTPDMGFGKMLSDPNLIQKLKTNPKTRDLMKDPSMIAKIENLKKNPMQGAATMMSDPKLMTIMAVILGIDLPETQPGEDYSRNVVDKDADPEISVPEPTPAKKAAAPAPEPKDEPMPDVQPEDDNKKKAAEEKQLGNTLYKKRQFDDAITHYNKAWELHKDITYLNNRSAAEFEKGDYESAIKTALKAVEEGRELRADYKLVAKAFGRIGSAYVKQDDLLKAIEYFEKSLTEHRTPDILKKLRSAEKDLKIREEKSYIDPEKAEEARLLGKELFQKADWPGAVKAYTEMIKRSPEDVRGYSNRAAALMKLLSLPEAIKDCDLAISKDPNFIRAYIRKANALIGTKEYSKCLDTIRIAKEKDTTKANSSELDQLYYKAQSSRFEAIEGETPEQTMERVQKDPEVIQILQDPVMQSILSQAKDNPAALNEHMKNPGIREKINTLVAAGVIRTR